MVAMVELGLAGLERARYHSIGGNRLNRRPCNRGSHGDRKF